MDELTTAAPAVQAALLRVVLERKVGFHSLPPHVRMVAAANPLEMVSGGWELSSPLCNRFLHLDWSATVEAYLAGLNSGFARPALPDIPIAHHRQAAVQWRALVSAFLRTAPHLLTTRPPDDHYAFATPRTWDYAIALLASCEVLGNGPVPGKKGAGIFFSLLVGSIGKAAAIPFIEFVQNLRIPSAADVLDGRTQLTEVSAYNDSEWFLLFRTLTDILIKDLNNKQLVPKGERFLALTKRLFDVGKRDVAFVSLRRLLQAGFSTKMLEHAHTYGLTTKTKIAEQLNEFKNDEGLAAYFQITAKK